MDWSWWSNISENQIRFISSKFLAIAVCFGEQLVYGPLGQSNMLVTLDICSDQPGRNQIYQRQRVDKVEEVQIVYRLFLVNCYLLYGNMQSQTEADRDRSI